MTEEHTTGMDKVREGLVLLIDGLIADTGDIVRKEGINDPLIQGALRKRCKKIEGYFADAINYNVPEEDLETPKIKYAALKFAVEERVSDVEMRATQPIF